MDREARPVLNAIVLSDGRPGHFNLADGVIAAAQRLVRVDVTSITVRRGRWPGAMAAAWSNSGLAPERLLSTVYKLEASKLPRADLVVSAGAETLAANVACARLLGAANIFYGSLRRFTPENFDLVLTSYPTQAIRPRHALMLKSSAASALAFAARSRQLATPPTRIALLVGGPSGESSFKPADWDGLVRLMEEAGRGGIAWLVSNSRRTPDDVSDRLRALSLEQSSPIQCFADVRKPGATSFTDILREADAAVVTDESSSMVSDAVTAGLPTIGLFPKHYAPTQNERDYRLHLTDRDCYRSLAIATSRADTLLSAFANLKPLAQNQSAILTRLLQERIPRLFEVTRPSR